MSETYVPETWRPSPDRAQRVKELSLSSTDFAALTGANVGFSPAHQKQWMTFWKQDICEKDEFHTWFPQLSLAEARRVWLAMEEHFFAKYDYFLRVWPEWCSSGIWAPPYPGSRAAGGMVDYKHLPLPAYWSSGSQRGRQRTTTRRQVVQLNLIGSHFLRRQKVLPAT